MKKSTLRQMIKEEIKDLNEEDSAYQKKFRNMLKKFNVKSPNELSDEEKKKFFQAMDISHKAKKETD